jgi:hypothetical protein
MCRIKRNDHLERNWALGLPLIVLTTAVHATGIAVMAFAVLRIQEHVEAQSRGRLRLRHHLVILIVLISAAGLLLVVLHGIEAALWAAAYWWLGALESPSEAILYSVDSMSTRGASGLVLPHQWRMMGALEATDGMLLFGISTAFIFAIMRGYWLIITQRPKYGTNTGRKHRQRPSQTWGC